MCVLTSRPTYQRLITLAADLSEYVWLPQHMCTDHMRDLVIAATKLIRDLPPTSYVLSECGLLVWLPHTGGVALIKLISGGVLDFTWGRLEMF